VLDNPHMQHAIQELRLMWAKRRWNETSPTYVREWLGRWVNDSGSLFYKFHEARNTFDVSQLQPWGPGWLHVLGWDLGFRDHMALAVWGWHPQHPDLYEAFSWKWSPHQEQEQAIGSIADTVMAQITALEKRGFNFVAKVADTGGGGRMFVEEVMSRHKQSFEAAKKTDKYDHVRLMNDDFLSGRLKLMKGSAYVQEISQLPKDPNWPDPDKPEKPPTEDPRFENHCCDGALYSWRWAYAYLYEEQKEVPKKGSEAFFDATEEKYISELTRNTERESEPWWERDPALEPSAFDDGYSED
jgi:hypothetical protein